MAKPGLGERLKKLFTSGSRNEDFYEELEDLLIEGDIGASTAMEISDQLKKDVKKSGLKSREEITEALKAIMAGMLKSGEPEFDPSGLNILMVLGVNGVGKTTTIAKLADYYRKKEYSPVLSAGDTFRAAAIDQLVLHGDRLGIRVVHQLPGSDPGAVVYDSIESVQAKGGNMIIADTAGRMHNKANLVKELQKIDKIIASRASGCNYRKMLVIDATTGQNGLQQAEIFNEAVGIDCIVLSKYDSKARGGMAVSISGKLGIPFAFIGTGEKYGDLQPFETGRFLDNLLKS